MAKYREVLLLAEVVVFCHRAWRVTLQDEMDTWQLDTLDGLDNAGFLGPGSSEASGFAAPNVPLPEVPSVAPQRATVPASAFSSQPDGSSDSGPGQTAQQLGALGQPPQSGAVHFSAAMPAGGAWGDMPPLPPPSVRAASGAQTSGGAGFRTDAGERPAPQTRWSASRHASLRATA